MVLAEEAIDPRIDPVEADPPEAEPEPGACCCEPGCDVPEGVFGFGNVSPGLWWWLRSMLQILSTNVIQGEEGPVGCSGINELLFLLVGFPDRPDRQTDRYTEADR